MSVLMEQHQEHLARRVRLGLPVFARRKMNLPPPPASKPRVLPNFAPFNFYRSPGPETIIRFVALKHGLKYHDVLGQSRTRPMVAARREAVRLVSTHCWHRSLTQLGRIFHRDHTSILNLLRKRQRQGRVGVSPDINSTHTHRNETGA